MAKDLAYQCQNCCITIAKWERQCTKCGKYNSFVEIKIESPHRSLVGNRNTGYAGEQHQITKLNAVKITEELRLSTGIKEFDHVLGGGLVTGSVVLIGGDPGIGKSTILLQTATYIAEEQSVLYITGEELAEQVAIRAKRLGLPSDKLDVMAETNVEKICEALEAHGTSVAVLDSIQTIFTESTASASGNVAQVKESASILTRFAKSMGVTLLIVGHVTKEGALAGPRVLEHMVDCVLYFEIQRDLNYRMIRAVKNRFGAVNELGILEMTECGLKEVINPATIFLNFNREVPAGSLVMISREGTRPFLVEVQAVVSETAKPPRHVVLGLEHNRLSMLIAVIKEHADINLDDKSVFINIVGGLKITETGSDLAVLLACVSSLQNQPLPRDVAVFGEVGLLGEIRSVPNAQERIKEAQKHGFKEVIVPEENIPTKSIEGIELIAVKNLKQALEIMFGSLI